MEQLYREVGYSRQGLSQHQKSEVQIDKQKSDVLELAKVWRANHPGFSARTLFYSILNQGIHLGVGINRFERWVAEAGMNVRKSRPQVPKTSDGKGKKTYPNLTNGLVLNGINQLIVGDITYYMVDGGWHFIFCLKDVYSQFILCLLPSKNMKAEQAVVSLKRCISIRGAQNLKFAIHHTDNGSQYEALIYLMLLNELGMQISRSKKCKENGSAEQLNDNVKNRYLIPWGVTTYSGLVKACKKIQKLNNEQRAIKQLGNRSPVQFEEYIGSLPLEMRPTKVMFDFKNNEQ